ncbi:MAG: DUF3800 domain-containing protein [Chloroflexi bacterium]|nr:DUF3800 domain-containing protein [Chloroflexota bacterium]
MAEFIAYIDESGDEGIGKGSRWFVLAAVVVESGQNGSALGQMLTDVKRRIQLKSPILHWTNLSHPRRLVVSQELAKAPVVICAVLVDMYHPDMRQATLSGGRVYFYAFRWLVERITWLCGDQGGQVRLRPENKAGISYKDLQAYLSFIQGLPDCQIRKNCILDVKPRSKSQLPLLQFADAAAGAITAGFEHKYGVTEPGYLLNLKGRLYRRNTRLWGYGLKFMPHAAANIPMDLLPAYQWVSSL